MKKGLIIFLLLYGIVESCLCQKIDKVEIDKFTGEKRIITKPLLIVSGLSKMFSVYLRSVDTTLFISLYGNVGTGVVGPEDAATFLFDDKTTFKVYPTSIQSYNGVGTDAVYEQQYYLYKDELEALSNKKLVAIRRTYSDSYVDINVKDKAGDKVKDLANLFLNEYNK